ncbi:MAG: DUF434 domain-containing protein [Candidatus Aminicenantes bacterium]|nr:DUF434 domain-containing protein [Candidatus Aminicenantes bacterium]
MVDIVTGIFKDALQDYLFLLNRGYPEKPAVKLVGDRYRLSSVERIALYRGLTSEEKALRRRAKITVDTKGKKLYIDGYNVLFTLMNYLFGKLIFIGNDGLMRDCGETYGKIENETLFYRAVDLLLDYIGGCKPAVIKIYFDSPVSGSEQHVNGVEKRLEVKKLAGDVLLVKSADEELKEKTEGIIATCDSEIIDNSECRVVDLTRGALENNFKIEILDLGTLP